MKKQIVPLILLGGILLAFIAALHPLQTAHAKTCYDANQQEVPCPETDKKSKPTDVPPVPTADAGIAVPPGGNPAPEPGSGFSGLPFSPWLLGLGGILIGVLIGLLPKLGSFFDRGGGNNPRGVTYPIDRPGGDGDKDKAAFDAFRKTDSTPSNFGPGTEGGDPHEVRFIIDKPAPDGPLGPGDGGGDLVSERDVPETPPGSPRPEPQPRIDGFDTEMGNVSTVGGPGTGGPGDVSTGGGTGDGAGAGSSTSSSSTPKIKPGGGPASDGPGSGVGGD